MKRVIYISFVFAGLMFTSCQKEEMTPVSSDMQVPVWDSTSENQRETTSGGSDLNRMGDDTGEPTSSGSSHGATDVDITDPNADPDEG